MSTRSDQAQHREVLRLAVPAFLALIAEPLFLLADSAIVGHLGTAQLAGLGVASALLLTAANIFVFLAYGTTSAVARQFGSGSRSGALAVGIDGTWLAIALGVVTGILIALFAEPLCRIFGASPQALAHATTYLRISAAGIPAMLVVLATTGVLRGLQDTRTPLVVSVGGFTTNVILNVVFVYGFGWGIGGSAIGTVLAQSAMAAVLVATLLRYAARERVRPHAQPARILQAARTGIPLFVRTLALRGVLVVTTWVAAGLGDVPLAAYQVAATMWTFLAFAVDAIAIAAQAITGKYLGSGDVVSARAATRLMIRWGLWSGVALALLVVAAHRVLPPLFTGDPEVRAALSAGLLVVALMQPLAGVVFVIDGVLIGAGDNSWLAKAMTANLLLYLPLILTVHVLAPSSHVAAVVWLWLAFTGFMLIRAVLIGARVRTDRWMVTGATR